MLNDNSKGIHKLIFERICQNQDEILTSDPEYMELGKIPFELLNQLIQKLSPEDRQILDQYDSGRTAQMDREDEILYSRGIDGWN